MAAGGHAPGDAVTGVTIAFTILAFLATVARIYTRTRIVHNAGLDDLFNSIALALTIVLTATMCMQVKYGMGRHSDTLTEHENKYSLIWFWASVWIYYLALCFAKLSIILQYLRIFPNRRFRRACFALIAIIVGWTMWAFLSALFACWPIHSFWDGSEGTCLNRLAVWFSNAAVNIATDLATAIIPLPVLKSLNIPKKQRYILMAVFGLGGVVCIISVLRLSALYAISVSSDVSWDNPLAAIWSSTEVNVGILCSCLPTLKGCVTRFFPHLFTSSNGSRRVTPVFELSGPATRGKCQSHISANRSQTGNEKQSGRFSRLGKKFSTSEIKEMEEGSQSSNSSHGRTSPNALTSGIHVTTIVEQEEERDMDEEIGRQESESIKGLVPVEPYHGT
ncbi:Satratoxin biosynthesis SC1 cluster protein 4 [Pseudocercospora fuligena]|uniref:Satratoxin biosynthesis SC1 cluster protein 4 n=1 Tax=Pseudocercospora fuligena TaxID=685502 RepID=A0A8H6R898_9PEZI|nr:Satratoxin biosynthesis SC1 cluster protein 4 [Pseudocercospora fuligena]